LRIIQLLIRRSLIYFLRLAHDWNLNSEHFKNASFHIIATIAPQKKEKKTNGSAMVATLIEERFSYDRCDR